MTTMVSDLIWAICSMVFFTLLGVYLGKRRADIPPTPESTGEEHRQWADKPGVPGLYLVRWNDSEFAVHVSMSGGVSYYRGAAAHGKCYELHGAKWSLVVEDER